MKNILLVFALFTSSAVALASDFNQAAIQLAQRQLHAEIYHAGQGTPQAGVLYSTYSSKVDWRIGYTTVFVGKRKDTISVPQYAQKITQHIDTVTRTFSRMGLLGYFFIVYRDYEIAFQTWSSQSIAENAFGTPMGKAIVQDAGTFMDPALFAPTKDFGWLNSVTY